MSSNGLSFYCDNCGKYIGEGRYNAGPTPVPPDNAVTKRFLLIFMRVFCGDYCKRNYKK
jgi:hypothetical protein